MHDERSYCVYIVASRSHTLYIGVTGDLLKRVFQHKQKAYEGFSAKYNCNRLVWFERFVGPSAAIAREKQLKGWIRAKKIALIEKANPTWADLSAGWYVIDPTLDKLGEPLRSSCEECISDSESNCKSNRGSFDCAGRKVRGPLRSG